MALQLARLVLCLALVACANASDISPVQKVIELLDTCKAKVQKDLDAESKAMDEYTSFCEDESKDKDYSIQTAERSIQDLSADIEEAKAGIAQYETEIGELGSEIAGKEKELFAATSNREAGKKVFAQSEADLLASIDELARSMKALKEGAAGSFLQGDEKAKTQLETVVKALSTVVTAGGIDAGSRSRLQSFLQKAKDIKNSDSEDDPRAGALLAQLQAPAQGKVETIASHTGGIIETVEEMKDSAEDNLSELRKKEMTDQQSFEMIEQGLNTEISHSKEKLSDATQGKAGSDQALGSATEKLVDTKKSKAADEEYLATLQSECQTTASEWEARLKSAKEEMGAIDKAKEILVSGVKVLVQISSKTHRLSKRDEGNGETDIRKQLGSLLKGLARKHHSFQLAQLAASSSSDPFAKIRGLCEEMIEKLMKEAEADATHEAFCEEEMAKSKKTEKEKSGEADKFKNRIDTAETTIATLKDDIKTLQAEVAEIDKADAAATKLRQEENAEYKKASKDYKDSAEAVAKAIEVLKNYYEGSLIQVSTGTSHSNAKAPPKFGGKSSDAGGSIISILEFSEEDFTSLLAEVESDEEEAATAYDKLTAENQIAKASKSAESKAKESEVQSLTVTLENAKEDHGAVKAELDTVLSYLEKLKPECETKLVNYAEVKAAREAEIEGLKSALEILSGNGLALVQTGRRLLRAAARRS